MQTLRLRDLRNIRETSLELGPGLNVFVGRNGQGKTSLLEAVGLVARGRSFRTDDTHAMIRRGAESLVATAAAAHVDREAELEVELGPGRRAFRVNGRDVRPGEYHGRLDVVVYSSERLRVVHGTMRDRRQFLDRQAAALWPAYRAELRQFERVLAQRNAALEARARDEAAWSERFAEAGARMRVRRAAYAARLSRALETGYRPAGERYEARVPPFSALDEALRALEAELEAAAPRERAAGRSLAGPQRDPVEVLIDGRDAKDGASSGQARSLLLALALASLAVLCEETGSAAVALLDDLDSELDEERAGALCAEVARRGQAWVTTAHPGWAASLRPLGRLYEVSAGAVRCD